MSKVSFQMQEKELEISYQNFQKLYSRGMYKETLEEIDLYKVKIKNDLLKLEALAPILAISTIKNYSELTYLKIQCLSKLGKCCCALKNARYLYGHLRTLFLDKNLNGQIRNSIRNELLKITQLYQTLEKINGPDNLLDDFNRIFYTKILL
jgi:hypothetical protein